MAGGDAPLVAQDEELFEAVRDAVESPVVNALFNAADVVPLLLDEDRRVVAYGRKTLHRLGVGSQGAILGLRPGDLLECINSHHGPDGCGSSNACRVCGAARVIIESRGTQKPAEGECLMTVERDGRPTALEMQVKAVPMLLSGRSFTFLFLRDISDRKRLQLLERIFLHDIKNTVAGLYGWSQSLAAGQCADSAAAQTIFRLARRLTNEIAAQRDLLAAEAGELEVASEAVSTRKVLEELRQAFADSPALQDKHLELNPLANDVTIETDRRLLARVLSNMLQNALEASSKGERIEAGAISDGQAVTFYVTNPGVIDEKVGLNIFRRSFSTKAKGRGLGTWSIKLIGERYLGGKVGFDSAPGEGTRFWLSLNR